LFLLLDNRHFVIDNHRKSGAYPTIGKERQAMSFGELIQHLEQYYAQQQEEASYLQEQIDEQFTREQFHTWIGWELALKAVKQ